MVLIAPQFVKLYVKSNKNDTHDAKAICEAVSRPHMRFVPAKSVEQQDLQSLHRVRSRLVSSRTQLGDQVRGLLLEYRIMCRNMWANCGTACRGFLGMRPMS